MSRGFLAGVGWGTVVAGFGLIVASQVTDLRPGGLKHGPPAVDVANAPAEPTVAPNAVDVKVPEPSGAKDSADMGTQGKALGDGPQMPQDTAPSLMASAPDRAAQPEMPVDNGRPPVTSTPDALGPSVAADAPTVKSEIPALPDVQATMERPVTPDADGADAVSDAARRALPVTPLAVEAAPVETARAGADLPVSDASDRSPEPEPALPEPPAVDAAAASGMASAPVATEAARDEKLQTAAARAPDPAPMEAAPDMAENGDLGSIDDRLTAAPALRPAPGLASTVDGVKTGRLPVIGLETAVETAPDAAPNTAPSAAEDASLPPVERFARAFENTNKKPLFAILLQDTGGPDIDREALAAISFPVSFVIDPALPDAAMAAQIYRAAGQEVLMLASGIPAGATASDIAISLDAMAGILPEAVALVDPASGGFQGNRTLAAQVLAVVSDQGRGVVSWDRGLNSASQVARREGIRNAVIFRALDDADERRTVIRRYLDRAAFKAAQDGRVVVLGQTRPETVAAVLEWAVEGRAATVALAPATAVMTAQ
ncbi:divergent polysaccharide deacetylase family protein [Pseudorhodobacter sp.]|uniref:divergent polysaccharide deacetylase family protein n=1 Tax=Pseudorhodobacter sp. TaxID=1934400 RepID=UPI002AFE5346|nr:divergent polysaccharide deacetylase family protein [Pseudorhodobacter sp.]